MKGLMVELGVLWAAQLDSHSSNAPSTFAALGHSFFNHFFKNNFSIKRVIKHDAAGNIVSLV